MADSWNEPETHIFLDAVLADQPGPLAFIYVGASVGEFVIDVARHDKVTRIVAFEPIEECAAAIRWSAALNGRGRVDVYSKLVNEDGRTGTVCLDMRRPTAAAADKGVGVPREIPATTLDQSLGDIAGKVVLLIDVEGAEPSVLRGGSEFLRRCAPLIIFEYNATSRKHFSLDDIRDILGKGYVIFRLTGSGMLDLDFEHSWNCVAVSTAGSFMPLCNSLICKAGRTRRSTCHAAHRSAW